MRDYRPVDAARRLADEVLAPAATEVDQSWVPASHIAAVKASGVLSVAEPAEMREVSEILAGACASTWLVQVQHHSPARAVAASDGPVRDRLAARLSTGELLAGVAFAHLRAHERSPVQVTPVEGGWRFDGTAPWVTGWGLSDVVMIGGLSPNDEVVFAPVDAADALGLVASEPLRMAAVTASRTVRLTMDALVVPDADVVSCTPYAEWAAADRRGPVNVNPAVFGITRAALQLVDAAPLERAMERVRRDAYALLDEADPDERREDRLRLKIEAGALAMRATTAAIAAGGGRSMALTSTAQRLAREALFLVVQAQTAEVREYQLAALVNLDPATNPWG